MMREMRMSLNLGIEVDEVEEEDEEGYRDKQKKHSPLWARSSMSVFCFFFRILN